MTPDTDSPDSPDRLPRPTVLGVLVGSLGVLVAGCAVAVAGFLAGGSDLARAAPDAVGIDPQHGQLDTFPLHDEKTMKGIGKGVILPHPHSPSPTPAP